MISLHSALRILAAFAGAALLYIGFFLHEDEEGLLQNRLEELWIRTDEMQKRLLSRQALLLSKSAQIALDALTRIFGETIFSWTRVRAFIVLSLASALLAWPLVLSFVGGSGRALLADQSIWVCLILGPLFVYIGLLPALVERPLVHRLVSVLAIIILLVTPALIVLGGVSVVEALLIAPCGFIIATLFIGLLRWLLKKTTESSRTTVMLVTLALSLTAGFALNYGMYKFANEILDAGLSAYAGVRDADLPFWERHSDAVAIVFATNAIDSVLSLLVGLVIATCLMHQLLWPFVERPIYVAQRRGLLKNTKLLSTLGFSCVLFAVSSGWPQGLAIVKYLRDLIH